MASMFGINLEHQWAAVVVVGMHEIVRTFKLPEMVSLGDEDGVRGALDEAPGIGEYEFDMANRQVRVVLNDPDAEEDIRRRLDHAGYRAQD